MRRSRNASVTQPHGRARKRRTWSACIMHATGVSTRHADPSSRTPRQWRRGRRRAARRERRCERRSRSPAPAARTGISEKMITSHHDKNYAGAVKNLNAVETDLAALKPNAPGYLVAGLRERELLFANSITLHENYFGNLGGGGKRSGALDTR